MKLYVSGPMTGYEEFNYPAFNTAKAVLVSRGYDVVSPADTPIRSDWVWIDYIIVDIDSVFDCDGVATLDGFEASQGSRIECKIAQRRGIPIKPLGEWLTIAAECGL